MLNGSVKELIKSNYIIVEMQPTVAVLTVVMRSVGSSIVAFDGLSLSSYLGLVIQLDGIKHTIAFEGITPVDLPDGIYYSDSSGNLTTTPGLLMIGDISNGYLKFASSTGIDPNVLAYGNGGCC
jgi:hypothetical protein